MDTKSTMDPNLNKNTQTISYTFRCKIFDNWKMCSGTVNFVKEEQLQFLRKVILIIIGAYFVSEKRSSSKNAGLF